MLFEYKVVHSDRKTIAIQVDEECNITVKVPNYARREDVDAFVLKKKPWLEKAVKKQMQKKTQRRTFTDAEIKEMRKQAKEIIPEKVEYYSRLMGVKPACVKINSAKKRFGSCSPQNNLNFSLYVMAKDTRFIDYVVIHELAHIKHHNHSKAFYDFVARFMPDYKEISKL